MSFSSSVALFGKKTANLIQGYRRMLTRELFHLIIDGTPVDTGQLKGNWRSSIGSPNLMPRYGFFDKSGEAVKGEVELVVLASDGDKPVFLTNGVFYAHKIEYDGWSHTKAPQGMVRINLLRMGHNRVININAL